MYSGSMPVKIKGGFMLNCLQLRFLLFLVLGLNLSYLASAVVFPFHIISRQLSLCSARLRRLPEYTKINPANISKNISFGDGVSLRYGIETVHGNYLGMEMDVYDPDSYKILYILVNGTVMGFETTSIKSIHNLKKDNKIKALEGDEFFYYHRSLDFTLGKKWAAVIKEKLAGVREGQALQFQEISGAVKKGVFLRYGKMNAAGEETVVLRSETTGKEDEVLLSFVVLSSIKLGP